MPKSIQSVERAADIMRVLATQPRGYRLAELARSLGLAKATVHGILRTLRQASLVEQDTATGEYWLGAALLHLGSRYLDGNRLRTQALGRADWLAERTGESVYIGSPHAGAVLIVHRALQPGSDRRSCEIGSLLPAHSTALGKALLGEASIAAAIHGSHGTAVGAIGITGALERLTAAGRPRGDLVSAVRETARALEHDLAAATAPTGA